MSEYSSLRVTQSCLEAIRRLDPTLHAFISPMADSAMEAAERADRVGQGGERLGLLHGIPVAIKDNIAVAGIRCTSGSAFFADYVPPEDAFVVARLRRAGAIVIGKTNLHEFAYGGTSQNEHYGFCRNPWDPRRLPGGSSGGSAVAAASGMCISALGTDTGASIRMPAALNGVCGLRPTIGLVSNRGVTPVSPPYDTVGPIARRVDDLARLYSTMAAWDPLDPGSCPVATPDVLTDLRTGIPGVRITIPTNFFFDDVHLEIKDAVYDAASELEKLGAIVMEAKVPGAERAQEHLMPIIYADAASFHRERLEEQPARFGRDVLTRLEPGRLLKAIDYAACLRWLEGWKVSIRGFFAERSDAILTPTVSVPAPLADSEADVVAVTAKLSKLNWAWPAAGVPSLSLPCGFTSQGLPIGLQLASARLGEPLLLRIGYAYQSVTEWHLRMPAIARKIDDLKGAAGA